MKKGYQQIPKEGNYTAKDFANLVGAELMIEPFGGDGESIVVNAFVKVENTPFESKLLGVNQITIVFENGNIVPVGGINYAFVKEKG